MYSVKKTAGVPPNHFLLTTSNQTVMLYMKQDVAMLQGRPRSSQKVWTEGLWYGDLEAVTPIQ